MPNRRRLDWHIAQALRHHPSGKVIVAPAIFVFSQWVESLLVDILMLAGQPVPAAADTVDLNGLWATALAGEMNFLAQGECLLAVRQARAADRLLQHWWGSDEMPTLWLAPAFRNARTAVARQLQARHCLAPEGWLQALAARLDSEQVLPCALPQAIMLDGFHEITRLEQRLLDALQRRGVLLEASQQPAAAPTGRALGLVSFPSLQAELTAAAHWAQDRLRAGRGQIAVVINELDTVATEARTLFEAVFSPADRLGAEDLAIGAEQGVFHISRGERLASFPVIQDALTLLSLTVNGLQQPLEFPAISRWLLSPYWRGSDEERAARAQLEHDLRRQGRYWHAPLDVARGARSRKPYDELSAGRDRRLANLLACCDQVTALTAARAADQPAARRLHGWLQAWGWPGPLAGGTDVSHAVAQFGHLLERLERIAAATDASALALLRQQCNDTSIVLRGGVFSPVQVISPEDAVGQHFDAAWVANMHDGNWPAQPRMNPFLPGQAAQRIPRSSAAGELAFCQRLTARLHSVAPEIRFTWSRQSDDVPNAPSALLADLPATDQPAEPAGAPGSFSGTGSTGLNGYHRHPWLVAVQDRHGLPLQPAQAGQPAEAMRGGASMLREQSICPMMAYLHYRLNARFEDMPSPFANAAYRGTLMHTAMQALYAGHCGQAGVPAATQVAPAVQHALHTHAARQRLLPVSLRAERRRLENVLHEWLDFERQRNGFRAERLEEEIHSELLGHGITVKADRIDLLVNGTRLIIDYKSSKGSTSGWADSRLQQAQLPLYAVLLARQSTTQPSGNPAVGGIALATVRKGECTVGGIVAAPEDCFDQIKCFDDKRSVFARRFDSWSALLQHWHSGIDALAGEIIAGVCDNSLHDPNGLAFAGLDLLLRREEGSAWLLANATQADGTAQGAPIRDGPDPEQGRD